MAEWVGEVRRAGAQFVIALTHIGSKHDFELAEQIPGIDIIVGGHDHRQLTPPPDLQRTLIVQTGDHGRFLGRLDLTIDRSNGKVVNYQTALIPVTPDVPEDPGMLQAVDREKERAQQLMQVTIGETLVPIPCYSYCECSAGNLLVDAIFERITGAQVGFMLNGHWQNGLEAGPISLGQLNSALRSTGNPARVELSGAQIKQFLMNALKPQNIASQPHAFRGISVGLPHVAGLQVFVKPASPGAIEVLINGAPLLDDTRYVVATSDIEISDILNYLYIPDDQVEYEVPTILADAVEDYIRRHSPITGIPDQRIIYRP
jgi:2',3'-cyclic-nucleotide 2'-phosphodiesterase (5'-nucleotidase family)